jgi:formylglycine-generating enzyme required for sulfatase activity/tRNA A-37 threonylcarbamoyl transferase component Bud32
VAVELVAGARIAGKLRLVRPLGQGGMGVVWAAHHETLDKEVAVKLIRPERVAANPDLMARFEREAKTTARISHPHVVHVMDYGTVDDAVPYIVMELLNGFSLAELIESGGRLSLSTARVLVQQVGSALESAHERGVVHRDIKPHNVFILEESQGYPLFVKVLDFGIAKMLGDAQVPGGSALTETGTIVGSPPYMSPEQIEGSRHVDLRSDLWSLGVITYEALTGKTPFRGNSFVAVGAAVLEGRYEPATHRRPGLPRRIDDWFAKALSVDPDGRFQTAEEMIAAFQKVGDEEELPSVTLPPVSAASLPAIVARTQSHAPLAEKVAPPPRRRWIGFALAGVAVLGAGFGVFAFMGSRRSQGCPPGMKRIDAAAFKLGSRAEGETPSDETPQRDVALSAYCLDELEVSVAEYRKCTSCPALPANVQGEGLTPNAIGFWGQFCNRVDDPERQPHPVNCVDWQGANAYCEALGKRLPSEEEWEFAARGREASSYPWGEATPSGVQLNACGSECKQMLTERLAKTGRGAWPSMYPDDDHAPATAPVGRHPAGATPSGVLDLSGNVWEWTSSHYCRYDEPECGDSRRVIRGGGWDTVESRDVRSARRLPSAPSARSWSVGFRCAKTP